MSKYDEAEQSKLINSTRWEDERAAEAKKWSIVPAIFFIVLTAIVIAF